MEGDANSRYFHSCVRARGPETVFRPYVLDCWGFLARGCWWYQGSIYIFLLLPFLGGGVGSANFGWDIFFGPFLSAGEWLSGRFSLEQVVLSCDGNKILGPDEFNFVFIKAFWPLIKVEVGRVLFDDFFTSGTLPKSFSSSYFLPLIPKVESPFTLGDY